MQTCSNCGASVREGARFCTACGTQLNEASSSNSPFSWGAAIDQTEGKEGTWLSTAASASESDDNALESSPAEPESVTSTEAGDDPAAVDEETGIVLDDPEQTPETGLVDPTEIDDLDVEVGESRSSIEGDDEPDLSTMEDDASATEVISPGAGEESQDTLAAWTQNWSAEDDSSDAEVATPPVEFAITADSDDEEEETLAKAERLIAELHSLVPKLARPKPADPNQQLQPRLLADELDDQMDGAQWADLRQILEDARDHPHDINSLMTLSSNASRMLELLDDRERLAIRASSVARRLRGSVPEPVD